MTAKSDVLALFSVKLDQVRHFELTFTEFAHRIEKLQRFKSVSLFVAHTVANL